MWLEIILGLLSLLGYFFFPHSEAVDVIHRSVAARGQQYPFENTLNSFLELLNPLLLLCPNNIFCSLELSQVLGDVWSACTRCFLVLVEENRSEVGVMQKNSREHHC